MGILDFGRDVEAIRQANSAAKNGVREQHCSTASGTGLPKSTTGGLTKEGAAYRRISRILDDGRPEQGSVGEISQWDWKARSHKPPPVKGGLESDIQGEVRIILVV